MDHDEALEQLQTAAVEPGGLDRLMAGDTSTAAAVAGHVAGCPACADELERLRRAVPLLRDVVRTTPAPDLRERTLALVRARGVDRTTADVAHVPIATVAPAGPAAPAAPAPPAAPAAGPMSRPSVLPWIAAIAAAVILSVVASTVLISARFEDRIAAQDRAIAGLEAVTTSTLALAGEPDVRQVALTSTDGSTTNGSLMFSPSAGELVVVASGLTPPPDGMEYRCWVLSGDDRAVVGKMYFADELAYWAGATPGLTSIAPGATFGVSLTEVDGSGAVGEPVLVGEL